MIRPKAGQGLRRGTHSVKTKRAKPGKAPKAKPRAKVVTKAADKAPRKPNPADPKFKPEFIEIARRLCQKGFTDQELADAFGVSKRSLMRWKHDHPGFTEALQSGKEEPDDRVERSLYSRAIGYETDEEVLHVIGGKVVKTTVRKHYPPDTTAGIFWLKNRRGLQWRDVRRNELSGPDGGPIQAETTPLKETASRLAFLLTKAAKDTGK